MHLPEARHYSLYCPACGTVIDDDGYVLNCHNCDTPSLLKSCYSITKLQYSPRDDGLFRFRNMLPVQRAFKGAGSTVVFRCEKLSSMTGIKELWAAFSGYWPRRGAFLKSCSFKELEAYCVLARVPQDQKKILVISSAGNTAVSFAHLCSDLSIRCLIVIPQFALGKLRFPSPLNSCVQVLVIDEDGDYMDTIRAAEWLSKSSPLFVPEGGARNVARRDGLGCVIHSAFETIGEIPEYYFQAIGSGTGAIGAYDTALRLQRASGCRTPCLMLSQNSPFTPIHDAWSKGQKEISSLEPDLVRHRTHQLYAPVLSNGRPPYALRGGLYEALRSSDGRIQAISNEEGRAAERLFYDNEGVDLEPAAAIAVASLLKACKQDLLPSGRSVLLNLTGGGNTLREADHTLIQHLGDLHIKREQIGSSFLLDKIYAQLTKG